MPNDQDLGLYGGSNDGIGPRASIVGSSEAEPPAIEAALAGLLAPRKTLPPSLFYDEEGCRLFYEITKLPEYYLTRTEFGLLEAIAPEAADRLPAGTTLVEYGASDETKAEMLLRQVTRSGESVFRCYIPIDVAAPELAAMRDRMAARHAGLTVAPVIADFLRPIVLPERDGEAAIMGFFPGSTIGNLEPDAAVAFLRRARITLGSGPGGSGPGGSGPGGSGPGFRSRGFRRAVPARLRYLPRSQAAVARL
jgi:uncharacterized SAM-dependent methyltransferase